VQIGVEGKIGFVSDLFFVAGCGLLHIGKAMAQLVFEFFKSAS